MNHVNPMNPLVKPGMIVHKGIEPNGDYYRLTAYEEKNGATFFSDALPTLVALGASYNLHREPQGRRRRLGRAHYLWYHELTKEQYEATEVDPVVQKILQQRINNKAMSHLLLKQ